MHRTNDQRLLHPSRWTKVEWEERKTLGKQHNGIQRPPPPHPALLKGGREKKGKPRGARLPKKSPHEERTTAQGKKEPEGRKRILALAKDGLQKLPTATKAKPNICHNLILSNKPIVTPRKKEGSRSLTNSGSPPQDICVISDIAN